MPQDKSKISSLGTVRTFMCGRACSDTLFHVISDAYGHPLKREEKALMPLAGGIMQYGYQCGMIWGATAAAGAQAFRLFGPGPQAETAAILAAKRVVESFRARQNTINCLEITELDNTSTTLQMITYFLLKGGTIGCFRMAARYAPVAFAEIDAVLSRTPTDVPSSPVSCAALVARKLGMSEEQAVMVAGYAGGIGLSGGACGALGAAIWINGMNRLQEETGKIDYKDPRAMQLIDRFIKGTDFKFECSDIVGRTFADVGDHAGYLQGGGCSHIIDLLTEGMKEA